MLRNDPFYKKIGLLILPIVLQNLLSAAVNSADVVMLNYVGQSAISAVSLASQYARLLFVVFFGLGAGVTMLCAQYYGKGDMHAILIVQGIAMRFSLAISSVFAVLALLIPGKLMLLFTDETDLIAIGASYIRWMSVCYICWSVTEVYIATLRSSGRVLISTLLNILAFSCNVFLNAVFIFGLFGAPKLGAVGVAIATSLSRLIELLACFAVSALGKDVKLDLRYLFVRDKELLSDFIRLSLPALGNDAVWGTAFSMYSVIIGHLGTDAVAANSFVLVVQNFGTVLCFGLSNAGSILIGNMIGENKADEARVCAKKVIGLAIAAGIIGGLIILAATPFALRHADLSDQARHYLKYMLFINVYYVMGISINNTMIAGIFRSGGDSRFGLMCDILDMWCYAVPLGFFAAFVLKLPVMWVYFLICTDEFVKWPWVIRHYRSGKWLNNITRERS